MAAMREYRSFSDLRRAMRGSASWTNHIDEIAESVGRVEDDQKAALFDSHDDHDDEDDE
jgi:hypothetical protein